VVDGAPGSNGETCQVQAHHDPRRPPGLCQDKYMGRTTDHHIREHDTTEHQATEHESDVLAGMES